MEGYLVLWIGLSVLGVNTDAQLLNNSVISTKYNVVSVSAIDVSIVARTFDWTRSILECSVKCSGIAAPSFYFIKTTSTCHCNTNIDINIASNNGTGTIKYGFNAEYIPPSNTDAPVAVYCGDQTTGWTAFQRRLDGSVDFYRVWTDYVNGFGNPDGEFWLGLEQLHAMTAGGCELCIYLEAGPNTYSTQENGVAMYSSFSVGDASTNYTIHFSGFSGTVGDSFTYHNGSPFSTYDNDNDFSTMNCAMDYQGAWWYTGCHYTNLNGLYLNGDHPGTQSGQGVEWSVPWGHSFSLIKTEMAFRC